MGSFTIIATFALLVGAAVASIGFKQGHEYEYSYYGKAISGIPNLGNQFAGVILRGQIKFQRLSEQTVVMRIERMQAVELNGPVPTGPTDKVLEQLERHHQQTIQQTVDLMQLAPQMQHPVIVQYENGKIHRVDVHRDVPEWVVNIEKGVLSMIKLKLDESLAEGKADQMNRVSKQLNRDVVLNYDVMEEDVAGVCKSTYTIASQPWESRPVADVLNVTKIRDYNQCQQFQQFTVKTLQDQDCPDCQPNKNGKQEVYTDVAVMRYNLRGSRHSYEIERVETQEQFLYTPYTANADYYLTNTSRTLQLKHRQPVQTVMQHQCQECRTLRSLQYRLVPFGHREQALQATFDLHKAPVTPFNAHLVNQQVVNKVHLDQLVTLIRDIALEMRNVEQEHKPQILAKTLQAKKLMRMLNLNQVEQVYEQCKRTDNNIAKRVCQDVMVMAGTSPCIMVLKKAIETEQIKGEEAAIILQQIPTTILTPHYTLLREIKHLTKCATAQRDSQVYTSAWLSYGTLISIACNGTGNTRETPSFVPKNFYCPTEMKVRMIEELGQELRQVRDHWRKTVLIHAIGNTRAPEAIGQLLPYVSGQATDCPVLRSKAIHALTGAAKVTPRKVIRLLKPVFFNVDEVAEVRAAALAVIVKCHPTKQFLSKIAASTWTEPSQQIGSFVYSTIKSLAHAKHPCLKSLKKDAVIALELCNQDFEGNFLDSKNMIYDDDKMDMYKMFNTLQTYWIKSNESIIPTEIMAKLNTTYAGYNFNQFSAQLHLKGVDEVLNRIFGPKAAFFQMRSAADLFRNEKNEPHKGFRQLVEALQIDTEERETGDLLMNLYVKFFDTQARNFHITKQSVKNFITGNLHNDLSKQFYQLIFGNGLKLNHHKLYNAHERLVEFATPLGLPMVITVNSPVYMGVQGHMNVEVDASRNPNSVVPTNIRLSANIRPIVIMKKMTTVGVVLPYDLKHAAAVVSRKTIVSLPINGVLNINVPEAKVTFVVGRSHQERMHQGAQQLPVVLYQVKPFTCIHKFVQALPYFRAQNVKLIQTVRQPHQYEEVVMSRTLGLPIVIQGRHEHEMTSGYSLIKLIKKNGIWNSLNTMWLHPQTFKYSEHFVRLHLNNAETKEVEAVFDFDFTNSQLQRQLRDGHYTPNQIWSFLFGWANLPMPCKAANQLNANIYDTEYNEYKQYNQYNRNPFYSGYKWDNEYEDASDYEQSQYNKKAGYTLYNKLNFWKNWQNTPYDQDDEEMEGEQGNWFTNYRQSRRYPFTASRFNSRMADEYEWSSKNYNEQLNNAQIHKAKIQEHIPTWKLTCKIQAIGGQQRSIVAIFSGKRNFAQLQDLIKAEIRIQNPKLHNNQINICSEAVAQYPSVPCAYDHTFNPSSIAPIIFEAKNTWGHNGCSAENHIHLTAKVGKSGKQLHFEQEAKPWYYKQCMEERQKGLKFNEACSKLYDQVTALNKIDMKVQYNNLPYVMKNATHKVDDFLKAYFYTKMSNDAVSGKNQPQQVRVVVDFQPEKDAVDVKIEKPTETTRFNEIKTKMEPLSAHRTIAQQVADAITGRQVPATCDISGGKYINTFNNLTYKHEMGQCTYLAARDCSPNGLFAVLVSGPQSRKSGPTNGIYCEVQLLKNQIKLVPLTASMTQYKVLINGQHHELTQGETIVIESGYLAPGTPEPLAYITLDGHFVHVKAPAHGIEIKFDGKNVRVQTSYFYAGKMCGLCGNFDGETKNEFEGPQGCIYGKARDFAQSYIVSNGECQQQAHEARKTCQKSNQESTAVYPQLNHYTSFYGSDIEDAQEYNTGYETELTGEFNLGKNLRRWNSDIDDEERTFQSYGKVICDSDDVDCLNNKWSRCDEDDLECKNRKHNRWNQWNQQRGIKAKKHFCKGEDCLNQEYLNQYDSQYKCDKDDIECQLNKNNRFNRYDNDELSTEFNTEYERQYERDYDCDQDDIECQEKLNNQYNQYNKYNKYSMYNGNDDEFDTEYNREYKRQYNCDEDDEECKMNKYNRYNKFNRYDSEEFNNDYECNCDQDDVECQENKCNKYNKYNRYNKFNRYDSQEFNTEYDRECDQDDDECQQNKYNKFNRFQTIDSELDNNRDECQCDETEADCDCSMKTFGFRKNNAQCTVYRNMITYGKSNSQSLNRLSLSNLYSRLSFFGSSKYENDEQDSYYGNGEQICFSLNAHKQCKAECQPKQEQLQTVHYHCMSRQSQEAEQLLRLQPYQRLSQLQDKQVHMTKQEYIPTYCQAY